MTVNLQALLVDRAKLRDGWIVSGFHWQYSRDGKQERLVRAWMTRSDCMPVFEDYGDWQPALKPMKGLRNG